MDSTTLLLATDTPPLATIDGISYYELAIIIGRQDGQSAIVGLARDWPIFERNARIRELERLLAATQDQATASERHCQELIARNEELARQLADAQRVPVAVALAATGMETPKRRNHSSSQRVTCPHCPRKIWPKQLEAHIAEQHRTLAGTPPPPPPPPPSEAIVLAEPTFVCAACHSSTFARSVADPDRCVSCLAHDVPTNGQVLAAA